MQLRVKAATWEAPNIVSYDLRLPDAAELPPFTAGAHIDLTLPNDLVRSYSLVNPQAERHRYIIAVQKDRASRGGSHWLHLNLRPGDMITASVPRNNFVLDESAGSSIFIAGGIGVTPIISMTQRLSQLGRDWRLVYCARKEVDTAFVDRLKRFGLRVRFNFDEEPGGAMLDIGSVVRSAPPHAHLYCCGPLPMLAAFEAATSELPRDHVHTEYFIAKEPPATVGGFEVVLAKTGRSFTIPIGKSILDVLLEAGLDIQHSCIEGVCGTCETRVLEGIPDHRDVVLTQAERSAGKIMMICCSGAKTEKLVLDL